jgi:hypothetical protein
MSNFIKVTDLKGRPMLINTEGILSVHQEVTKEQKGNVYELQRITHVMMDKDWGYACKEDPRLVYDLILESEVEYTYDQSNEDGDEGTEEPES